MLEPETRDVQLLLYSKQPFFPVVVEKNEKGTEKTI